jgi:hypothetical protein
MKSSTFHHRGRLIQLAIGLFSLLMLTTLPVQRAHQFQAHYRTPQIRRTFERHAEVAHSDASVADKAAHDSPLPLFLASVAPDSATRPIVRVDRSDQFPNPQRAPHLRLKLGPSASDGQDPLI